MYVQVTIRIDGREVGNVEEQVFGTAAEIEEQTLRFIRRTGRIVVEHGFNEIADRAIHPRCCGRSTVRFRTKAACAKKCGNCSGCAAFLWHAANRVLLACSRGAGAPAQPGQASPLGVPKNVRCAESEAKGSPDCHAGDCPVRWASGVATASPLGRAAVDAQPCARC